MNSTNLGASRPGAAGDPRGTRRGRRAILATAAIVCGLAVAACGSDDDATTTTAAGGGAASTTAASGGGEAVAAARKGFEAALAGTDRDLPSGGPAAVTGKNVWVISCSQAAEGCQVPSDALAQAGKELGWKTTVVDAKLDPVEANKQIRSATSAGADAIVLVGSVSCDWAPGSLQEAKKKGIKLYGLSALDCDESGGEALFDAQLLYGEGNAPYVDYVRNELAPALADAVTVKSNGSGDVMVLNWDDGGMVREMVAAIKKQLAEKCPDCTIRDLPFTAADIGQNRLQAKVTAGLNKHKSVDVVVSPVDGPINLGAGAAVAQATAGGREILLTGWEGFTTNLKMIAGGGPQQLALGVPGEWRAWAAADGLNRLFAGEDQVDAGIGLQMIDPDNPPPAVPYDGNEKSQGYADNYKAIWSGSTR